MDIVIFLLGLVQIFRGKYAWAIAIIILLASSYLQLNTEAAGTVYFPFKHNVNDTGLLLYLIFFAHIWIRKGIVFQHKLTNVVIVFYSFLIINGIVDVFSNVPIVDVIKFSRHWIYLTLIWILPYLRFVHILKSLKIILYITLGMCLLLFFQRMLGLDLIGYHFSTEVNGVRIDRGVKPPIYVIPFILLLLADAFKYKAFKKWIFVLILFLPIILTLKMTYFITVLGGYIIFLFVSGKLSIKSLLPYFLAGTILLVLFFSLNQTFTTRLFKIVNQTENIKDGEVDGNFSFRILHTLERTEYILQDPLSTLRGIGFISETHFNKDVFEIGLPNKEGEVTQLDTADIAWSLLILRLGFLGLAIFIMLFFKIITELKRYRNIICMVMLSYMLVSFCFGSLGNAVIASSYFYIIPLLFTKKKMKKYAI